jgi:hypothetical protein
VDVNVRNEAISADTGVTVDNIDFHIAEKEIGHSTRIKNTLLFYSRVLSIFWQFDP